MKGMNCPRCGKELRPDTKLCPYCNKRIKTISREPHYSGVLHQQGRVVTDEDYNEDVLKPRTSVSLSGIGDGFSGSYRVSSTRHKFEFSKDDAPQKIRCLSCGTVNDDNAQNCRNCGARIT